MLSPAWLPTMRCASPPAIRCGMNIDARPMTFAAAAGDNGGATAAVAAGGIGLAAWQGWGTSSPVRSMVVDVIEELRMLVKDLDSKMCFGGLGGKLQGDFRIQEDKKHRTNTKSLYDSEDKLQFFAVQQIACRRLLGSGGYLCQRDFVRQNNTGKLLWQVFGVQAATCAFLESMNMKKLCGISLSTRPDGPLNFVLIDGIWNNSAAMFMRLKEEIPCISLSTKCFCDKLRPQLSWDRTCTVAAAIHLLLELHLRPEFSSHGLDKQAVAVESGLDALFDALTGRRRQMGRSTSRREWHNSIKITA